MKLSDRIQAIVDHSGLSIPKYSVAIGTKTPQAIRDLIAGRTKSLSADMQSKILSYSSKINPSWLLTGEGEMLINEKDHSLDSSNFSEMNQENLQDTYREDEVPERFISYLVPMSAMGGSLSGFDVEGVGRENCERVVSPIADIDWVVPVCGDSMEPEYPSGSRVYVRRIDPGDFIAWGNVYVLDTTNGLIIKVVVESEKANCVRCVSLNPSGRYAPFDVPLRAIRAMYRVMLCVSVK